MTFRISRPLLRLLLKPAAAASLALALAACTGGNPLQGGHVAADGFAPATPAAPATAQDTAAVKAPDSLGKVFDQYSVPENGSAAAEYRLAPMDVVDVTVFDAPNLSRSAQVSAAGLISLPLIKDVKAAGRTTDDLQKDIAQRLGKDFMQSPQVFVSVKEYNSQRVTVDGAVKNAGVFPLKGETSLMQVLALAGGITDMASESGVYVLRKSGGEKTAARFDLHEIRTGKKEDPAMRAGDIVIVDESSGKLAYQKMRDSLAFTGLFRLLLF